MLNIDEIRAKLKRGEYPVTGLACDAIRALCDEVEADRDEIAVLKRALEMSTEPDNFEHCKQDCDGRMDCAECVLERAREEMEK